MRFPRYHLATSVTNRILELADQEMLTAQATEPPANPNVAKQGAALDTALQTPVAPVPAPVGSEEVIAIEAAQGGSAADAIGGMAILDAL